MRTKVAIFQLTNACNMRCKSCNSYNEGRKEFDFRSFDKWVPIWKKAGIRALSLTGGEPTMHPNFVDIARRAKENGFIVHVASNGSRTKTLLKALPYISALTISLDSISSEVHDAHRGGQVFDRAVKSLKECRGKVKVLTANALLTVDPKHILKLAKFVNAMGIPLSLCYPDSGTYVYGEHPNHDEDEYVAQRTLWKVVENYDRYVFGNTKLYYQQACCDKPRSSCRAGEKVCFIDTEGKVHDCFRYEKKPTDCTQCKTQCFHEPSLPNFTEQMALLWRIYRFTHKKVD